MLPDHLKNSQRVYHGVRFDVHAIEWPSSKPGQPPHRREFLVHPGAVVILPLLDQDTLILIRNERFAVGKTLWELPAGTIEPHPETPESCARRELIEETGYEALQMRKLTEFYASPGVITELMRVFVATDLKYVGQHLEDTERITVHPLPWDKVMEMIRQGEIADGKTLATLLYYRQFGGTA